MWSAVLAIGLVLPALVGVAMLKARLFSADSRSPRTGLDP
jgi:hypothetical protein